jgi:hypothetical protein
MCLVFHILKTLTDYGSLVRKPYRNLNENIFLFCRHELLLYFFTISKRTFVYILLHSGQRKYEHKFPPTICLTTISFLRGFSHSHLILVCCHCVPGLVLLYALQAAWGSRGHHKLQTAVIFLFLTRVL